MGHKYNIQDVEISEYCQDLPASSFVYIYHVDSIQEKESNLTSIIMYNF